MKLSLDQRRVFSEFLTNIGVTWFAGGIVAPAFTVKKLSEMIIPGLWGVALALLSVSFALMLVKKRRHL